MTEDEKRQIALKVAFSYLGTPYIWGGENPKGFDCSGLMIECLQSVGLIRRGEDLTAQGLWNRFFNYFDEPEIKPGDLVFWHSLSSRRIIHVEMLISDELSIGASGGGSTTKTLADAWNRNAYIKIRPFMGRSGIAGYANPYYIT